jgi:hypothetical protein
MYRKGTSKPLGGLGDGEVTVCSFCNKICHMAKGWYDKEQQKMIFQCEDCR